MGGVFFLRAGIENNQDVVIRGRRPDGDVQEGLRVTYNGPQIGNGEALATASQVDRSLQQILNRLNSFQSPPPPNLGDQKLQLDGLTYNPNLDCFETLEHGALHCEHAEYLLVMGSSTVFPAARLHASRYPHPNVFPIVRSVGSGQGLKNFLVGASDVSTASSAVASNDYGAADCQNSDNAAAVNETQEEGREGVRAKQKCSATDVFPTPAVIGTDQLTVVVGSTIAEECLQNREMTEYQAYRMFLGETLQDIFENAPGNCPNDTATISRPDMESGTYDFFTERLKNAIENVESISGDGNGEPTSEYLNAESYTVDDDGLQFVKGNDLGIAYFGVAYAKGVNFDENQNIAVAKIANDDGSTSSFIDPTETENPGDYALSRDLYMYVNTGPGFYGKHNYEAVDFVCSILSEKGQEDVAEVGYTKLSDSARMSQRERLRCQDRPQETLKPSDLTVKHAEMQMCKDINHITAIGSSTVFPAALRAARTQPSTHAQVSVYSTGSGIGIGDMLTHDQTELLVADASRPLNKEDYTSKNCNASNVQDSPSTPGEEARGSCNGILPRGYRIGFDVLSVIVANGNFLSEGNPSLSESEVQSLICDDTNWDDAVSDGGPPTANVNRKIPDVNSGTRDYLREAICNGTEVADLQSGDQAFVDDQNAVDAVVGDAAALGVVPFAFVQGRDDVTILNINGTSPTGDDYPYRCVICFCGSVLRTELLHRTWTFV